MDTKMYKKISVSLLITLVTLFTTACTISFTPTALPPDVSATVPSQPQPSTSPVQPFTPIPVVTSPAQPLPSIADVVAKVKPSVVALNVEVAGFDFFNRPTTQKGAGSGWIISPDGIIVTNNHVVADAKLISVTLDDGRTFPVDLDTVKTDALTDLAILKINADGLPAARVGDSARMRIGDWVVAIGNALGEGTRATQGIISRKDVSLNMDQTEILYGLIETDAAINPGNSGGTLVNMSGEVIGINSAKLSAVGVEATGFAISTGTAVPVIEQLMQSGTAIHPWLGVSLAPIDQLAIQNYNLTVDKGALVVDVGAGSPAALAGVRIGDVIVSFDGKNVGTVDNLIQGIRQSRVGQSVEIIVLRGASRNTVTADLVERPN